MSAYSPASEIILRHSEEFITRRVLFAGDLQDTLPATLKTALTKIHTQQYHHWLTFTRIPGLHVEFGLEADAATLSDCDTLIYYWPKNKSEAQFQLHNLLSILPPHCDLFITGENRSGVRSAQQILSSFGTASKIDSARRCGLWHARLQAPATFDSQAWWQSYKVDNLTIKTLPGVFSRDGLDSGSELLLSTFTSTIKGSVLDVGCGAGVLSAVLASRASETSLSLCDVNAMALSASKATLAINGIAGTVFASHLYSDVTGRFDLIISNPPFHEGTQTTLDTARRLIQGATSHLNYGGELRIVANAFLPYPDILDETFGRHDVLAHNGRYKVYRAIFIPAG